MASGFPGRDDLRGALRFGVESTGGLLKRSLKTEQDAQSAVFVRSVKQKYHFASPISSLSPTSSILSSLSSASVPLRGQGNPKFSSWSLPAPVSGEPEKKSAITNRLLQLERQLLDDEDDEMSVSDSSAVTNSEWSETMQKLMILSQNPPSSSSRQMLLDTATAISSGNLDTAAANLSVLKNAANKHGNPEQRLAAMMVTALALRINPHRPPSTDLSQTPDIFTPEHLTSSQMLYEASPCFKLALMTANLAILEAIKDHPKIHIVDFDVGQGLQLASFLKSLAERHRHHISVKITAFCDPTFPFTSLAAGNLSLVGEHLSKLADRLGIALRFSIVNRRTAELDRAALGCEAGEAMAVNFAFLLSRVADESVSPANPRDELLRRVKALGPKVVTLAEQEMNGNTAPFATRFAEACAHYGALLESMEAIIAGRESNERARVEACLARKACNSVAREGADRVERCEVYGKWKARLGMAGFKPVQLGPEVVQAVKLRLASVGNNPGFMVKEEDGRVGCGWMGRVITVASAWR